MIDQTKFLDTMTEIFRQELDNPRLELTMTSSQANIVDWDSLAHVRIILAVERAFQVQFDVAEIEGIDSVRGIYDVIARHNG
jgi:acyl carrier protein